MTLFYIGWLLGLELIRGVQLHTYFLVPWYLHSNKWSDPLRKKVSLALLAPTSINALDDSCSFLCLLQITVSFNAAFCFLAFARFLLWSIQPPDNLTLRLLHTGRGFFGIDQSCTSVCICRRASHFDYAHVITVNLLVYQFWITILSPASHRLTLAVSLHLGWNTPINIHIQWTSSSPPRW